MASSRPVDDTGWFKIAAEVPAGAEEALLTALGVLVEPGAEVLGDAARPLHPELADMPEGWIRLGLYSQDDSLNQLRDGLEKALGEVIANGYAPAAARIVGPEPVEPGWTQRWRSFFHVTPLTPHLTICPPWEHHIPSPGERVLDIEPGAAFGTGGHATTQLCLESLDGKVCGQRVLDVGTGSGILSIAAAKLRARRVVGIDTDPMAVEVAHENAARNAVDDIVSFSDDRLEVIEGDFDVVVANIVTSVLRALRVPLVNRLAPSGVLVLSGILAEEADSLQADMEALGLVLQQRTSAGGWACLTLCRTDS